MIASCAVVGLAGCIPDNDVYRRVQTDVFVQEPKADVDILWVVDNSPSMAEEQDRVANGFEAFMAGVLDSGTDFHVGVVTTDVDLDNPTRGQLVGDTPFLTVDDDYLADFQDRVRVGIDGSDKERGLEAARMALTEPLASGANFGFLREEATLALIFVSDENDCSDDWSLEDQPASACYDQQDHLVPVRDYIDAFRALKPHDVPVLVSAIVGPDVADRCADSWPGYRYQAVADATGGVVGDICETDYGSLMEQMGLVVSGVLTVFNLTYVPVEETIEVVVDDELIPEDPVQGWQYDAEYNTIRFDGKYVPPRGTTISVSYEIAGSA